MGLTKKWFEQVELDLVPESERENLDDLQRLISEWPKINEEKKKVIMSILDLK